MENSRLISAYGFGSYFRMEAYNDIDILLVIEGRDKTILETVSMIEKCFKLRTPELSKLLHITFVTQRQFSQNPLRDMHQLINLGGKP